MNAKGAFSLVAIRFLLQAIIMASPSYAASAFSSSTNPLLPQRNDNNNNEIVIRSSDENNSNFREQTLGDNTYRIDTSQIVTKMAARRKNRPFWKKAMQTTAMIAATPIIIPTLVLYTISMYIGPKCYKNKMTAMLVTFFMKDVGELFDEDRNELLWRDHNHNGDDDNNGNTNSNNKGIGPNDTVLDLGAGSGCYLKYLSRGGYLVAIEPVNDFHDDYKKRAIEAGLTESQMEIHSCDLETYVNNFPNKKSTFDWIILGNVLCEVPDQISTLHCVDQLLKPGGYVYFSEHVGMPRGTWSRRIQDLFNPLWRTAGAGCNCNRDSLINIRSIKGWHVISWHYFGLRVVLGPFVLGLARKNPTMLEGSS